VIGAAVLLLSIGLQCARRVDTAMQICAVQALLAAASLGATPVAIVAFALNGVALPLLIARMDSPGTLTARGNAVLSWIVVLALLVVIGLTFGGSVAIGVSVVAIGLLLIVLRSHPLAPAIGLLSSQNGLALVTGSQPDRPLTAMLVAVMPLTATLVLAERWARQ
jgi:hypothetical protein